MKEDLVIRFGRVKYIVKKIVTRAAKPVPALYLPEEKKQSHDELTKCSIEEPGEIKEENKEDEEERKESGSLSLPADASRRESEIDTCRICRGEVNTPINPLMSACKCSGSIKYVHANCMKAWYHSKMLTRTTLNVSTYTIKGLECELCKTKLPLTLYHNGLAVELVNITRPESGSYIELESIQEQYVQQQSKEVHIISLSANSIIKIVLVIPLFLLGKKSRQRY